MATNYLQNVKKRKNPKWANVFNIIIEQSELDV
jgi:hypothetical protein